MPKAKPSQSTDTDLQDSPWVTPPQMTILSDHPARGTDDSPDYFGLGSRLSSAFDILRHKETRCPITIAVYGDWGTGKTSAMRWLESHLLAWNAVEASKRDGHPRVYPVWFDPWKYHSREEVWRGIIAEVILASFRVGSLDREKFVVQLREAAKRFGIPLGKGFLHALANIELKVGTDPSPELTVKGEMFREVYEEFEKAIHPEKAFLNEFEESLKSWIRGSLKREGDNFEERVALFIEDLDRCLPEVTLEVLEAIKLYLNIQPLMFVVGLDRSVVDGVVRKHYEDNGLGAEKSRDYLNKIFQVEIQITPSERQIEEFLDKQVEAIDTSTGGYWNNMLAGTDFKKPLEEGIRELARHNPREIKRLLNSALLRGRSAVDNRQLSTDKQSKTEEERKLHFAQGVQVFLIQRFLDGFALNAPRLLIESSSLEWFSELSWLLCKAPDFEPPDRESAQEEDKARTPETKQEIEALGAEDLYEKLKSRRPCQDNGHPVDIAVLELPLLWSLLRVPFSVEVAQSTPQLETAASAASRQSGRAGNSLADFPDVILNRVALRLELGKPVGKLTLPEVLGVSRLVLSGSDASNEDIKHVDRMTNLQSLELGGTQVSDATPLQNLANLKSLDLSWTLSN